MIKDIIPFSIRIKEATNKLKNAGYVVINNNDTTFAILAERKKIICKGPNEFFKITTELTNNNE